MPWAYIRRLLGPGMHWGKSKEAIEAALAQAQKDGNEKAAGHLKIILALRNKVAFDKD